MFRLYFGPQVFWHPHWVGIVVASETQVHNFWWIWLCQCETTWNILECDIKWALGSITVNKAGGVDGILAISNAKRWCCWSAAFNMPGNLENSTVATGLERSVFIPIPKKGHAKECSKYCTTAPISDASQVILKIHHVRIQRYVNRQVPDVQRGLRKGRGIRDPTANIHWIIEKAKEFWEKINWLCFMT